MIKDVGYGSGNKGKCYWIPDNILYPLQPDCQKTVAFAKCLLRKTYTPPVLGQPVASSADTRADGIRKMKAAAKKKNTKENPSSAIRGRARRLAIITTFIIASANTPSIGFLPLAFRAISLPF